MVICEPDLDREALRQELKRFPYLSDKNRTDERIEKFIDALETQSVVVQYSDGYFAFCNIRGDEAEAFWIHLDGHRLSHLHVRAAKLLVDSAMNVLGLKRLTMKTADNRVARIAQKIGFVLDGIKSDGFEWEGMMLPQYRLVKEG